ncbi:MAG TPA: FtsX-like permease family protein [Casimicrobiaceae bacterium]|nr:FtsX-like permease family protein [Casimicrobiaceae bacterium]
MSLHAIAASLRVARADVTVGWWAVTRQWRRSGFCLCAIGVGVAALMLAGGFIDWNFLHYREAMIHTQLGHIRVHRAGYTAHGAAAPFDYVLPANAPELRALRNLPTVRTVAPRLAVNGLASHGDATVPFVGEGIDPIAEGPLTASLTMVAGAPLESATGDGVIVGQGLARNLGVRVGDNVVLVVNTAKGGINGTEARVRGVFTTVSKAYDDTALRLSIGTAQKLERVDGAHTWVLLLHDTAQTSDTLATVERVLGTTAFEAVPWSKLSDFYNKSAALFSRQVGVMRTIIGLLIVLSIGNALTMGVMERTTEIGTAMALGSTRKHVLRRFLVEGVLLGVLGAGIGIAVGAALARIVSVIGISVPPPPGMAHGYIAQILVTPSATLAAALLAIATTIIAALYPAWKASRMVIVDALRRNR